MTTPQSADPNLLGAITTQGARPEGVPDKFWDDAQKMIRTESLLSSYLALEKKLARLTSAPAQEEDRARMLRALGRPDDPTEYAVDVSHGLFSVDPDLNLRLHEKGFTPDQVQTVYDVAAEKLVPLIIEMASLYQADREVERLVAEFGGTEKWAEISRQLLAFGKQNLPEDVLKGLASSYDGVMALYRLMMQGGGQGMAHAEGAAATGYDEKALQKLMRDPKYWRDKNPEMMAKVAEGFKQLYG